jgi:hypothetical protein
LNLIYWAFYFQDFHLLSLSRISLLNFSSKS